jgi:hypothetical protein
MMPISAMWPTKILEGDGEPDTFGEREDEE